MGVAVDSPSDVETEMLQVLSQETVGFGTGAATRRRAGGGCEDNEGGDERNLGGRNRLGGKEGG